MFEYSGSEDSQQIQMAINMSMEQEQEEGDQQEEGVAGDVEGDEDAEEEEMLRLATAMSLDEWVPDKVKMIAG